MLQGIENVLRQIIPASQPSPAGLLHRRCWPSQGDDFRGSTSSQIFILLNYISKMLTRLQMLPLMAEAGAEWPGRGVSVDGEVA